MPKVNILKMKNDSMDMSSMMDKRRKNRLSMDKEIMMNKTSKNKRKKTL